MMVQIFTGLRPPQVAVVENFTGPQPQELVVFVGLSPPKLAVVEVFCWLATPGTGDDGYFTGPRPL